jgi:Immunity protein 17
VPILISSIGVFVIAAAVGNWEWFFANWRAAMFVKLFGRDGARVAYAVLGVWFVVLGIFVAPGRLA